MLDFIKRNAKFVVTLGVSFLLVTGLTTALIVTNVSTASARGRDRNRAHVTERTPLTEEQIAERTANALERLQQRLDDGRITQEQFDERLAAIESGEFRSSDRGGRRGRSPDGKRSLSDNCERDFSEKQIDNYEESEDEIT